MLDPATLRTKFIVLLLFLKILDFILIYRVFSHFFLGQPNECQTAVLALVSVID